MTDHNLSQLQKERPHKKFRADKENTEDESKDDGDSSASSRPESKAKKAEGEKAKILMAKLKSIHQGDDMGSAEAKGA